MRRNSFAVLLSLAVVLIAAACGKKSDSSSCGGAGQLCCNRTTCDGGLSCQAGSCAAGDPCGASGQACCSTGTACLQGLACDTGTCTAVLPSSATRTICATGGTLAVAGATLTIPAGAVAGCKVITLSTTEGPAPSGYAAYSPVFDVSPSGVTLAKPASLAVAYAGDAALATLFWSRQGTTGYEQVPAAASPGVLTAQLSRFGEGFVADGVTFSDPPDRSCVVGKMVSGRTMPSSSSVALFFTVDDCWGRPLTGLTKSDFTVLENGSAISPAEASATILQRSGLQIFASLVIDMSASTASMLPSVIAGAKAFVRSLQVEKHLPVQIDVQLFAGDPTLTEWQAPTLDTATLLGKLDALTTFTPTDRSSTNLNGAVVTALQRIALAEQSFADRNHGGAFPTGYLVLFTDGKDTAGRVEQGAVVAAEAAASEQVMAVGLQSLEYDATALDAIAQNGVVTVTDSSQLTTAFSALANRMEGQISRTYLLGYCSPKRAGASNTVSVEVAGAANQESATYTFDATRFAPGCTTTTFATICDGKQCGGLGCGACDDRLAACDEASSTCVDDCFAQGVCDGSTITNPRGYAQVCADTAVNHACGAACVDTTTDASNCGTCGNACGGGQHCAAGVCAG